MRKHLHLHGTARSGHHAVLYWLVGCLREPGLRVHYANQVRLNLNPLVLQHVNNDDFPAGLPINPIRDGMTAADTDVLISSTEDVASEHWGGTYRFSGVAFYEGAVIRDPFNQLASRFRLFETMGNAWEMDRGAFIDDFASLWSDHLSQARSLGDSFMLVDYNGWFDSEEYRRVLCARWAARLDLSFSDRYLNFVSDHGKGSSFDLRSFHEGGQRMRVHARWKHFADRDAFWTALAAGGSRLMGLVEAAYGQTSYLQEPIEILRKRLARA